MVKKIISILLISLYLFSATDLKELLKINVVIQHWHEHQQNDSDVSLFQFLVMHYVTDDNNDKDNERDKQLPFKSPGSFTSNTSNVFLAGEIVLFSVQCFTCAQSNFLNSSDAFKLTFYRNLIWQPPQLS